jgi:hypothetical protein
MATEAAFLAEVLAAAFFAAHRAFAATANFFLVAALMGFRAPFATGVATGAALAGFTVVGATAAFFAAYFAALFFFAQRFCWASAIRWRASGLIIRLVEAARAVFALFTPIRIGVHLHRNTRTYASACTGYRVDEAASSFRASAAAAADEAGFCPVTRLPSTCTKELQAAPFA